MGTPQFRPRILTFLLLSAVPLLHTQQPAPVSDLLHQFESETVFWRQFEVAKTIVAANGKNDKSILPYLEPWLMHEDRHLRGNAAFIFANLGDPRGFDVIVAILNDHSEKRNVERISSVGLPWVAGQIAEDRYYAAHLLGDLKDPRAIPILVPLLQDSAVRDIVPWSLGQIGDPTAIPPLIGATNDPNPNMRVMAIHALIDLRATAALPRLQQLLNDNAKSNFDRFESVAEAARAAITALQSQPTH